MYNHTSAYPSPQHRSIAYAAQSSMLYVLLYFVPELLHKREAIMREVIDKHFPDNWVRGLLHGLLRGPAGRLASPTRRPAAALKNIMSKSKRGARGQEAHSTALTGLNSGAGPAADGGRADQRVRAV